MELNTKSNNYWRIFVVILLLGGIGFFVLTKNAGDKLADNISKLNNKVESSATSSITNKAAIPEFIDKAQILISKDGDLIFEDVISASPQDQALIYDTFSQEKKDQLVKTWNEIKKGSNGDRTKINEFLKNKASSSVNP